MTRGRSSGLFAAAMATGLLILVWAAAARPVGILTPSGRRLTFRPPTATPTASGDPGPKNLHDQTRDVRQTHDLSWLGDLIIWAMFLAILLGVALAVRHLWRVRWRPPEKPEDVDFDVLPANAAEALRDDAAAHFAAVQEGNPRNGIVRCWLRLEEVVAAAGLPRNPWETSAEFTVRILKALDVDPRAIGELSGLYREARFSEHELDETARTAARSALEQLHRDLQDLGATGSRPGPPR